MPQSLSDRYALVVQGVRRCGKSTLLSQFLERYKLDRNDCLFINFEDPRLAQHLNFETLDTLTRAFEDKRPGAQPLTLFLDELQWVEGWERWLATKLDRPSRIRYVVSVSNSRLLSGEIASTLTGRHINVELYPFSFDEFKSVCPNEPLTSYLSCGGFPEPLLSKDRDMLLRQHFSDIVQRDVRERVGARSSMTLSRVVQMVFESAGSELSLRRIAAATGLSVETVSAYLSACQQAYLLFSCPYFSYSARKQSHRNRKYYPIDVGLRRVAITSGSNDLGKSLECAVYIELRKRFADVFYWRDGGEVDFVILKGKQPTPMQVSTEGALERHWRALDSFYENFGFATEPIIVNLENFTSVLDELDRLAET